MNVWGLVMLNFLSSWWISSETYQAKKQWWQFWRRRLFSSSSSLPAISSSLHFLLPSWGHTSETRKNKVCHKNQKERERTLRQLVSSFVKKRMSGINLGPYFLQNTLICSHPNSKAITCSTWMMGMDKCFWIFVLLLKAVARKKRRTFLTVNHLSSQISTWC